MPNFPVHSYGLGQASQWLLPAMFLQQKQEDKTQNKFRDNMAEYLFKNMDTMEPKTIRALSGKLKPLYDVKGYENVFDFLDEYATGRENRKTALDSFSRSMNKITGILVDPKIDDKKRKGAEQAYLKFFSQYKQFNKGVAHKEHSQFLGNYQKEQMAALKQGRTPETLTQLKAETYKGLTPEERKQVLTKPSVEIKIEGAVEKQRALATEKEKSYLKTARFRANVQKDVMSLNKDMWIRWTKVQKADAIKIETNKRIRQSYPSAQYGESNGKQGWYIKEKDKWVLVSPWNE